MAASSSQAPPRTPRGTRGENFPLKLLPERLRCPKCGLMKVRVWFEVPNTPDIRTIAAE